MKVLIADKFEVSGVAALENEGCEVVIRPGLKDDALRDAIAETGCAVLIVRSTKVTEAMLSVSPKLNVVIRAGAGYNTIDVDAASRNSILVANCPGKNAVAVAELTFALILALDRRVVDNTADLRSGVWNKSEYSKARGLKGRTLGVVGLGQIGQTVVHMAEAFGMNVVGWSRSLTSDAAALLGIRHAPSVVDVAANCDILTIHLAATPETAGIISADVLDALTPGSYVINTSRAEVVDYKALAAAVESKGLRVGLDVYPNEPGTGDNAFADDIVKAAGVVYGTHHIGASTDQAQEAIASEAVRIVREYKRAGHVANCVNLASSSAAESLIVVRHRNKPGVLAFVLQKIRGDGLNVEDMHNIICQGGASACAQIKLAGRIKPETLGAMEHENEHIIGVSVFDVGR